MRANILTVEDDPIVRRDLRLVLEDAGFNVCAEARDGVEAIEHARTHKPDLVLLDLGLPKLDGTEAARQIVSERRVPIVALTGRRDLDGLGEVAGIVFKPFDERALVGTLRDALDRRPLSEDDDYRLRVLAESMVSSGYRERDIEAALRRAART